MKAALRNGVIRKSYHSELALELLRCMVTSGREIGTAGVVEAFQLADDFVAYAMGRGDIVIMNDPMEGSQEESSHE